jgi:hypothetical protein
VTSSGLIQGKQKKKESPFIMGFGMMLGRSPSVVIFGCPSFQEFTIHSGTSLNI